jgi:hypothetical protein
MTTALLAVRALLLCESIHHHRTIPARCGLTT